MAEIREGTIKYYVNRCECGGLPRIKSIGFDNKDKILECNECGNTYNAEPSCTTLLAVRVWNNKGKVPNKSIKDVLHRITLPFIIIFFIVLLENIICMLTECISNLFK